MHTFGIGEERQKKLVADREVAGTVEQPGRPLLENRHLVVGEKLPLGQLLRPLERRHRVVGPDALQVRVFVPPLQNRGDYTRVDHSLCELCGS